MDAYPPDAPFYPRHVRGSSSRWLGGCLARMLLVATMTTTAGAVICRAICSRLTCNLTSSLPRGVYLLRPAAPIERGSIVSLVAPEPVRSLIAERRYLPPSVHLLKRVVAVAGDSACFEHERYLVNGRLVSAIARRDRAGRPLPAPVPFCGRVPEGFVSLAGDGRSSLDSRYFGLVSDSTLTPAVPLWTSSSL